MKKVGAISAATLITTTLAAGASAAEGVPLAYPADAWNQMFVIWLVVAVVIYLIVGLPIAYFFFRYRYRKGINEVGADEDGGLGLEVLWTVVPLIIVIYLAVQSAALWGGLLAILVLYMFFRNGSTTSIVALSIPILGIG